MSLSDLYMCNNELSADTEIVLIDEDGQILCNGKCFPIVKNYGIHEVVYFDRKIICIRTVYANTYQVKVVPL